MPLYEYVCQGCGHAFEALVMGSATTQAAASADLECPRCRARDLERVLSSFAVGAETARAAPQGPSACGSCGDPRGPGACRRPD